jgi:mannose-6-phosphate isomerase
MTPHLYPFKFKTIFKDKIWGGNKIKTYLGKDFSPLPNCGETWEISGVKDNVSIVANGELAGKSLAGLIGLYKEDLLGTHNYKHFGDEFPLLVKFIDAADDLSIQVHPNDELAKRRHNSFGKTEMWYVIDADPGATLITGFNRPMNQETYLEKLNSGRLTDILNKETVSKGDVFFLPAGRVHTIGRGLLIAEIQQTSDITYRIYDFDRVDANGNKRELHTDLALEAIDYTFYDEYKTKYPRALNEVVNVADCPYFTTNVLSSDTGCTRNYESFDSFVIHVCVEGGYILETAESSLEMRAGECVLIPASIDQALLRLSPDYPHFKLLESYTR